MTKIKKPRIPVWGWLVGIFIVLPGSLLMLAGLISFTPLGGLFGERWHYLEGEGSLSPLPDRSAIIYSSARSGTDHIYSIPWGGSRSRLLTNDKRWDGDACVSPDGKHIAFAREDADGDTTHIWLMDADGTGQHQLTFGTSHEMQPSFSPSRDKIAYSGGDSDSGQYPIWIMNIDGMGRERLTHGGIDDSAPVFDPSGAAIDFTRQINDDPGTLQVWTVSTSGGRARSLGDGSYPAVSPDGRQVAFYGGKQNGTLFIMNSDGTARRVVGVGVGDGTHLAFCTDGRLITYGVQSGKNPVDLIAVATGGGARSRIATIEADKR